jgi:hypothetical protein
MRRVCASSDAFERWLLRGQVAARILCDELPHENRPYGNRYDHEELFAHNSYSPSLLNVRLLKKCSFVGLYSEVADGGAF